MFLVLGRLLRVSLAPSAAADVLVGLALGGSGVFPGFLTVLFALAGSLLVYHGAMALNDWADADHDAATRPERPIPSGKIDRDLAMGLGLPMILVGVVFSALASSDHWYHMLIVAGLAVTYDLVGRGAWSGPLLLGACRAGNLGFGCIVGAGAQSQAVPMPAILACAVYGIFVFLISRIGRFEDGEESTDLAHSVPELVLIVSALLAGIPLLALLPAAQSPSGGLLAAVALCLVAGTSLAQRARTVSTAADVEPIMGMALRRLMIFTAALALVLGGPASGGWWAAILALAGFPLAVGLRRVFPPS